MEQEISNARVRIKMKGLGLAYFNAGIWEFLFLREIKKHELTIIVREYKKGSNAPIELKAPVVIDPNLQKIEITTTDSPTLAGHHLPAGNGHFTYNREDPTDARWVVNLSELYGNLENPYPVRIEKKTNRKLTLLTVSNAKLYCQQLSTGLYRFEGTNLSKPRRVGLWLGLFIEWNADSETIINIGNQPIAFRNHDELDYYEIEVNNDCYPCEIDQIDFHHYFKELVLENEITQIAPSEKNESPEKPEKIGTNNKSLTGHRVDCHLVQVSKIADADNLPRKSLAELL